MQQPTLEFLLFVNVNFLSFRDVTLQGNRWHCDCHLLSLRTWLLNRTLPWQPQCHSPPRLIGEPVGEGGEGEFACRPEVNPTASYLEVIEGKNISLVCTVKVSEAYLC